jgi:hypothetical protein
VFKNLIASGYSSKEYQAYWHLRGIAQSVKRGKICLSSFDKIFEQRLSYLAYKHSIAREDQLSVEEYKEWFSLHYSEHSDVLDVSTNDTAPERPDVGTFAQRLSYDLQRTREPHIIQTITDMLNRYKSILVVYGGGHRETQMPVIEQMLGQGEMHILAPEKPQPKSTKKTSFTQKQLRKKQVAVFNHIIEMVDGTGIGSNPDVFDEFIKWGAMIKNMRGFSSCCEMSRK